LQDLNNALELNPSLQIALENRIRLYMSVKRYADVITDAESVLRLDPGAGWARERINEARRLLDGQRGLSPAGATSSPLETKP
jgi:hypothetical protein